MASKAFQFRLRPTPEQLIALQQHAGATRWIWNQMVAGNIEKYKSEHQFNFRFDMQRMATEMRHKSETLWLNEINSQSIQCKCIDLDAALKRSFAKGRARLNFPKFKCKSHRSDSFRVPQFFKISSDGIKLPKISGWIKCNKDRKLQGKAKSITIKQDGEHWIAVVLCELSDVVQREYYAESEVVGLDLGLTDFVVLSDGTKFKNPSYLKDSERLLKKKQRQLSKKCKGSSNRNKARKHVAKLHRHVRNQRKDFQWKVAAEIANQYTLVSTEVLNISGMQKNHKLAKSIGAAGWRLFQTKLKHKLQERGGILVGIDPRNTSKTCSECGCLHDGKMELSIRSWICLDCGTHHDRDVNAALNIRQLGINRVGTTRIYGCGDTSGGVGDASPTSHVSVKQQNRSALADPQRLKVSGQFS